eukprot:g28187.t1
MMCRAWRRRGWATPAAPILDPAIAPSAQAWWKPPRVFRVSDPEQEKLAQASVLEADASGRYDPLPVKVPVEALQAWHDAEESHQHHLKKCCKAFMLMLFPCVAMRPGLEHNLTRGACDGRAFVKTGWVGQGTSEWDVCVVPKQEITQEGCAKYFAYSSKLDRFVACVYYDKVEDLMARNPTRVTARTKRHNVHICSVQDLNPVFKDKPHPPTVKCGKSDVPVKEKIDRWRFHAEKTCKESLCKKAQKGSWRKETARRDGPNAANQSEGPRTPVMGRRWFSVCV